MQILNVTDKSGKEHNVSYTQNLRYTDFLKANRFGLEDLATASELFNLCKAEWTEQIVFETKNSLIEKASTRAVLTKHGFKFRDTINYAPRQSKGSAVDIEAVKNWRMKRVEASEKAQSMAAEYLAIHEAEKEEKAA